MTGLDERFACEPTSSEPFASVCGAVGAARIVATASIVLALLVPQAFAQTDDVERQPLPPIGLEEPAAELQLPTDPESLVVPLPEPFSGPITEDPENPLAVPNTPTPPVQTVEPVIGDDMDALPFPVRRMRDMIMDAAKEGDFEALRPLIGTGADTTQLSLGGYEGDPIEYIRGLSGDTEGYEIMAILLEILQTGYAIYDKGTENEIVVWPYFVATSLEDLTPPQRVEMFELVTAGDFEDMKAFGAYIFYRVGITPDGRWRFFVAGD
jgi:hypothetical protein